MTAPSPLPRIPRPRKGLLHILDAAGYSLAGLRRLLQETAARLELVASALGAIFLVIKGAGVLQVLTFLALCAAVLIVEALNTALEILTDQISPGWSEAARDVKDLGSLAVCLTLLCAGAYWATAFWQAG